MKKLITYFSKKSLSLGNGPALDRKRTGNESTRPFAVLVLLLMLFSIGVGNVWGTDYFSDALEVSGSSSVSSRDGWSNLTQVYAHYGSGIRLASSNNSGSITKTTMAGIGVSPTTIVLRFAAKSYGTDNSEFNITVNNAGTANTTNFLLRPDSRTTSAISFTEKDYYEVIITGATSSTTITFSTTASKKRVILSDVSISSYESEGSYVLIEDSKDIAEGDYLIVYNNTNALNTKSGSWKANTYGTYTSISSYYTSGTKSIASNAITDGLAYMIRATTNGYYIRKKSSGGFLGNSSDNTGNYLRWDSAYVGTSQEWTLGVNSIVSCRSSSYAIRYNSGFKINSPTGASAVQLFKKVTASCGSDPTVTAASLNGSFY